MSACKGHITEDVAVARVLAALWDYTEDAAWDRWMGNTHQNLSAADRRVSTAVVRLMCQVVAHMRGPCCEHRPQIAEAIRSSLPEPEVTQMVCLLFRRVGKEDPYIYCIFSDLEAAQKAARLSDISNNRESEWLFEVHKVRT